MPAPTPRTWPSCCRSWPTRPAQLVEDPTEDEIARARAQLKASLLMGLESCSAVCEDLARQLLCFGRRVPTEELVAKIDAVDTDAVRRVGRQTAQAASGLTLAAVGPLEALPEVDLSALAA